MEGQDARPYSLIGRKKEVETFDNLLDSIFRGKGRSVFISGEAGIGKTKLIESFKDKATERGFAHLSGTSPSESPHPFFLFSDLLESEVEEPLFLLHDYKKFVKIFVVDNSGLLLAESSSSEDEEMDADIFAGMLSAVQGFVRDSFDPHGDDDKGLGRLEYGDMKILIEHGKRTFLTAVFKGAEHPDMNVLIRKTMKDVEGKLEGVLDDWNGDMSDMAGVQQSVSLLSDHRFLVRRDLESIDLEKERIRIANRVFETIAEKSQDSPLVLFLEDFHKMDPSSAFVLEYVSRNIAREKVLLVGAYRRSEGEIADETVAKMVELDHVQTVLLEGLDDESVESMMCEIFPENDFPETFSSNILQHCEGNPFFIIETLFQMKQEENIIRRDGRYVLLDDTFRIPSTIGELVQRRLVGLDMASTALLEYSSCIGRAFDSKLLSSFNALKDFDSAFDNLVNAGILHRKGDDVTFSHAIFREITYDGVSGRWKSAYHKSIGEHLESTYEGRTEECIFELADHFYHTHEYEKTTKYCILAGEHAEGAFATDQAIDYYEKAETVLSSKKTQDEEARMDVLERLGDVATFGWRQDRAMEAYTSLLKMDLGPETEGRIQRKVGRVKEKTGAFSEAMEHLEKAKELLGPFQGEEYARVIADIGLVHQQRGDFDSAISLEKESLEMFKGFKNTEKDVADILMRIAIINYYRGEYGKARQYAEQSLETYRKINFLPGVVRTTGLIGITYAEKGDYDTALEYNRKGLEIKVRMNDIRGISSSLNNAGVILMDLGDFEKAEENYKKYLETSEKIGDEPSVALAETNLGEIMYATGRTGKAREHFERAIRISKKQGDKHSEAYAEISLGKTLSAEGDTEKAEKIVRHALEMSLEMGSNEIEAKSRRVLGVIYRETGRFEEAGEHLETAIQVIQESGVKRGLGDVYLEYGRLLKKMDRKDEARTNLQKAIEIYRDLNVPHEIKVVENELDF